MNIYNWLIVFFWLVIIVYWIVSARSSKKVAVRDRGGEAVRYIGVLVAVLIFIFFPASLKAQFGHYSGIVLALGTVLCGVGVAFAIWARWHLGKNWNYMPSIQEGHELVTTGPYRFVRHPIYTGVILALLGSALASSFGWLVLCLFICVTFVLRIPREERFMMQLFPEEYPPYKARTKRLIPFVW